MVIDRRGPHIINHNLETVRRMYPAGAAERQSFDRSLGVVAGA